MHHHGGSANGRHLGGTTHCVCVKCGYKTEHRRGVPCREEKCPKCGGAMIGKRCEDAINAKKAQN